jgi:molecular chaperone GrpE
VQNKAKQQIDEPTKDDAEKPASPSGEGRSDAGRPAEGGAAEVEEGAEAADDRADASGDGEAVEAVADQAQASQDAEAAGDAAGAQGEGDQEAPPESDEDDDGGEAVAADEDQEDETEQEAAAAAPSAEAEEEDVPVTAQVSVQAHGREETAAARESERPRKDAAERADAEALVADLASVRSEAASYLDDLRRLQAEFDNYRKRMLREQTVRVAAASQALVARLLPVLDNFELAISHAEQSRDFDRMLKGVEMVFGELREVLRNEGLSDIEAKGKPFDPARHEAVVAVEEEGAEPGTVVDVVRTGYAFQGKVLRPAMVKVAK